MSGRRRFRAAVLALTLALASCGLLPDDATPTPILRPQPVLLPGTDEAVPAGTDGATGWIGTSEFPDSFDASFDHEEPGAVAEAFVVALGDSGADRDIAIHSNAEDRVVVLVTMSGAGDDSVFGQQYALVIEPRGAGWGLTQLYLRTLCRRGVDLQGDLCV